MSQLNLTNAALLWQHGKTIVFLISGKAGTGKTTTADILHDLLNDKFNFVVRDSFAAGVKQVARDRFGWNGEKDQVGRKLLQDVGSAGRDKNQDIWVESLYNRSLAGFPPDVVIVDDWRYTNECDYLADTDELRIIKIRLEAENRESLRGLAEYLHKSETALDKYDSFDYIIENTGSKDELRAKLSDILVKEGLDK